MIISSQSSYKISYDLSMILILFLVILLYCKWIDIKPNMILIPNFEKLKHWQRNTFKPNLIQFHRKFLIIKKHHGTCKELKSLNKSLRIIFDTIKIISNLARLLYISNILKEQINTCITCSLIQSSII